MSATINEDGTAVLIEAVYYRHFTCYAERFESVEGATGFLVAGVDDGRCADVGVFVDGQPRLVDVYVRPHPPSAQEAADVLVSYAEATAARR